MDEIKDISCEVKNCKYHDMPNNCNAGRIQVGSQSASSIKETACETFENSENSSSVNQ